MRTFTLAALVLAQSVAGRAQSPSAVDGAWTAELHGNRVYLQLRTTPPDDVRRGDDHGWNDWNMGQTMPVEELGGLPANDEHFTVTSAKFELRREAGTLALDGAFRDGRGAGLFTFSPRAEYSGEMKALGYNDDLPLWRRFQLAVHDVGPKYIKALAAEGYPKLTLDEVQRARNHGVTIDYIREMKALGHHPTAIEGLVRAHDHGVSPDYIK